MPHRSDLHGSAAAPNTEPGIYLMTKQPDRAPKAC